MTLSRDEIRILTALMLGKRLTTLKCMRWGKPICCLSQHCTRLRTKGFQMEREYHGRERWAEYFMTRAQRTLASALVDGQQQRKAA